MHRIYCVHNLEAIFHLTPPERDGTERILQLLIATMCLSPFALYPGLVIFYVRDWQSVKLYIWILGGGPYAKYVIAGLITVHALVLWTHTLIFCGSAILLQVSMITWLQYRTSK